jgi:hypothetical protein
MSIFSSNLSLSNIPHVLPTCLAYYRLHWKKSPLRKGLVFTPHGMPKAKAPPPALSRQFCMNELGQEWTCMDLHVRFGSYCFVTIPCYPNVCLFHRVLKTANWDGLWRKSCTLAV